MTPSGPAASGSLRPACFGCACSSWPSAGRARGAGQLSGRLRPGLQGLADRRTESLRADRLLRGVRRSRSRRRTARRNALPLDRLVKLTRDYPRRDRGGREQPGRAPGRRRSADAGRRSAPRPMRASRFGPSCWGSWRSPWTASWDWSSRRRARRATSRCCSIGCQTEARTSEVVWLNNGDRLDGSFLGMDERKSSSRSTESRWRSTGPGPWRSGSTRR